MKPQDYPPLDLDPYLPPPSTVKCGNRLDWTKAQRRHDYRYLGQDTRTSTPGFKAMFHLAMCITCGIEKRSLAEA